MSTEIDALKASVTILETSVSDAVAEIHSLADQITALSGDNAELATLAAAIKSQADTLHLAVYPPSSVTTG
jgi:hypothetical protein